MIRRADYTWADANGTPEPGVYITVKTATGALATLFNDDSTSLSNPFQSGALGAFVYNVATEGVYTEEYRLSLADSPRKVLELELSLSGQEGLLVNAPSLIVPIGTDMVSTVGADRLDHGGGNYVAGTAPTARSGFPSANARNFVLSNEQTIVPQQFYQATDPDYQNAVEGARDFLKATAGDTVGGFYRASHKLVIPANPTPYPMHDVVDFTHTVAIESEGIGQAGGFAARLSWAGNSSTGFRFQRYNTSGASTVDGVTHYGSDASSVTGLAFIGNFTTLASEGAYHGIHAKARVLIRDCVFDHWQGDGIHIVATSGGGPLEGNANCFAIERCYSLYNQHGIYIQGADTNAGYSMGCDLSYNRQWGLFDNSFLGNHHSWHHTTNNGFADNGLSGAPWLPAVVVSHGGNRYFCLVGQEVGASTNAPSGTTADNTWWGFMGAGGVLGASIPAWVSGGTYRTGGSYRTNDSNQSVEFSGCYAEGGQGLPQTMGSTLLVQGTWGGGLGNLPRNPALLYAANQGVGVRCDMVIGRSIVANGGNHYFGSTIAANQNINFYFQNTGAIGTFFNFQTWDGAGTQLYDDGYIFAEPGIGLVLNGRSTTQAGRLRSNGANTALWGSMGFNVVLGALGYGAGAGGAVTQATSRTTGVTLNKACGQITLFSAAGSATWASFTVTNSQVAATDVIRVNQASGADLYQIMVTNVGAGSFKISFATTGGTTTEAPVFNFAVIKAVAA